MHQSVNYYLGRKTCDPNFVRLFSYLKEEHQGRKTGNRLHANGSFDVSNKRLAEIIGVVPKTIASIRKQLAQEKKIKYTNGRGRQIKTQYWILDDHPKRRR